MYSDSGNHYLILDEIIVFARDQYIILTNSETKSHNEQMYILGNIFWVLIINIFEIYNLLLLDLEELIWVMSLIWFFLKLFLSRHHIWHLINITNTFVPSWAYCQSYDTQLQTGNHE